ncbi:type II secretion system protein [Aliivibrio fischeri]|uniref:type II secretion system protein n=1 Tax=Aliivibrio fischeri TaxID=668 RepID=UPI00131134CC|nr:type II secretion system protein [Aliivibrio fischeri]MUK76579.1 type II secretion system protein [Aliivibrio fischeri]
MKKQQGFVSVVALLIVGAILIMGIQQWSMYKTKQRIVANSQSFYQRVLFLRTQFHAFASDKYLAGININSQYIFPFLLSDLEGDYIPVCSDEDNQKGVCFKYNQTPWGEIADSDYAVIPVPDAITPTHYRAELTLKLPDESNDALKYDRDATLQLFAQLPNIVYDEMANTIVLRIDRPDKAFSYESLVKRSGDDSTLLGDWDVGGDYAITNAKDYTIKNDDGTQQLVSRGLVNISQVEHGDFIDKPQCPTDQEPDLTLSIHTVTITNNYTLTGSIKPYIQSETATQWQAGLVIRVIKNSTGKATTTNKGVMTAFVQCK